MHDKSTALYKNEQHVEAYQKALSAFLLNPVDDDIRLNVARTGSHFADPELIERWLDVLDHPDRTSEDLMRFLNMAVYLERMDLASKFLAVYEDEIPETTDGWRLKFGILLNEKRTVEVLEQVEQLIEGGSSDWYLHETYVSLLISMLDIERRSVAIEHLRDLTQKDGELSIKAALSLLSYFQELGIEEKKALISQVRNHPQSEKTDILFTYSIEFRNSLSHFEEVKDQLLALFDTENKKDLQVLTSWLIAEGFDEKGIELLDIRVAEGDKDLFLNLLKARIGVGEVASAFDMTLRPMDQTPLDSLDNFLARAKTLQAKGDSEGYRENLSLAIEVADAERFRELESELFQYEEWDLLVQLYKRFTENPETFQVGVQKLIGANYHIGAEDDIRDMLAVYDWSFADTDPSLEAFLCYLKTLFNQDLEDCRVRLERLVGEYPDVFEFRVLLGLNYSRIGYAPLTRLLLNPQSDFPEIKGARYLSVALAHVIAEAGEPERAKKHLAKAETWQLLPSEKWLLQAVN